MLEKADYTCNYAVIRQTRQPTHLPVICIIPSFHTRRIIKKKGSGKHFHNVLCLSEAKGMDIIMKKAKFIPGCVFLTAAMLSLVACGADKELPGDSNYITQSSGVDFDGDGIADHLYI